MKNIKLAFIPKSILNNGNFANKLFIFRGGINMKLKNIALVEDEKPG